MLIVMVSSDVVPATTAAGVNALLNVTSGTAVIATLAVAGASLERLCVVVSACVEMVLRYEPTVVPVTRTPSVQVALGARVPPVSATLAPPAVAATEPAGHDVAAFGVGAIVSPVGNPSVSDMPESATAPGAVFEIVIVNAEVAPATNAAGANALSIVSAPGVTVRAAVAALALEAPCVVESALARIVLV